MNPLNYAENVRPMPRSEGYNLITNGIPRPMFAGNFEWRDSLVTFALKELDAFDVAWINSCGLPSPKEGCKIYRYVSELTKSTGVVLIDLYGGRAAFPIMESPDIDVIIRFERLRKVKFINLIVED